MRTAFIVAISLLHCRDRKQDSLIFLRHRCKPRHAFADTRKTYVAPYERGCFVLSPRARGFLTYVQESPIIIAGMAIYEEIVKLQQAGRRGAIATIVNVRGSIPSFKTAK